MLYELRAMIEKQALDAARKLKEAKSQKDAYWIGYWTAYIQDRESLLVWIDSVSEDS